MFIPKNMFNNDYYKSIKPIKINYTCINCGRKRAITYTSKCAGGGLLSNHNEQCMPFMYCPRCKKDTMIEDKNE